MLTEREIKREKVCSFKQGPVNFVGPIRAKEKGGGEGEERIASGGMSLLLLPLAAIVVLAQAIHHTVPQRDGYSLLLSGHCTVVYVVDVSLNLVVTEARTWVRFLFITQW